MNRLFLLYRLELAYAKYPAVLQSARRWLVLLAMGLLAACSGGTGSGNNDSVTGADLGGSFVSLNIPLFYVKRTLPQEDDDPQTLEEPYAFNPGAQLYYRVSASASSPEINLSARIHGDNLNYDVKDLAMSPNGDRLLFAMHPPEVDPDEPVFTWDIWEYHIASDTLRKVIPDSFVAVNGPSQDINPQFLRDTDPAEPDRITMVYSSSRQQGNRSLLLDELKAAFSTLEEDSARNERDLEDGAILAMNLHVWDENEPPADQLRQISYNPSHDLQPVVMPDGQILFLRWDNFANRDAMSLYRIAPDGTGLTLLYGYHSNTDSGSNGDEAIVAQLRVKADSTLMALLRERSYTDTLLGGALVDIDLTNFYDRDAPTFPNIGLLGSALDTIYSNAVFTDDRISPDGRFFAAVPLHDGSDRMLVSWTPCLVDNGGLTQPCSLSSSTTPAAPGFGIWVLDDSGGTTLLQPVIPSEAGRMVSDLAIAETTPLPPFIIPPVDDFSDPSGRPRALLNIASIYDLDGVDTSLPGGLAALADPTITDPSTIEAQYLRLVKAVAIPDEATHEFDNSAFGVNGQQLMREIVGYLPIEPDGSVRGLVPANVPLALSIVDASGKRIGGRHQNWLQLGPNETFNCQGCHTGNSTEPHGRIDAQPPSINPGAPSPGIFPNTVQATGNIGLTMAESFAQFIPDVATASEREPSADLVFVDEWGVAPVAPVTISYDTLTTARPENPFCQPSWSSLCRIIINYETHIQPIWERTRGDIDDGSGTMTTHNTCVACHAPNGAMGTSAPAGQLDLTASVSDIDADHFTAYRELLSGDVEQGDAGGAAADRLVQCNLYDEFDVLLTDGMGVPLTTLITPQVTASATPAGARASSNFFNCFAGANACRDNVSSFPAGPTPVMINGENVGDCVDVGGVPEAANSVDHNGILDADELRLIAEWLDLGGQYYNNPFDAPTP